MNAYKVLQVDAEAEAEVIEAAYKRLAGKYHPDKNPSESATARMKEINAAYDLLKDADRRALYDRENEGSVRPRADPDNLDGDEDQESAPQQNNPGGIAPAPTVEQVSNSVVKKLAGIGAIIALLVYLPWLAAVVAGIWAAVWIFRKYPGPVGTFIKVAVAIAIAVGVRFYWTEHQKEQRTKEELAALDLPTVLGQQLDDFTSSCTANAARKAPELASAYCSCLADVIRTRFDMSAIHANSVYDYNRAVSARFDAAAPGDDAQTACVDQVKPKPVAPQRPSKATNSAGSVDKVRRLPAIGGGEIIDPWSK